MNKIKVVNESKIHGCFKYDIEHRCIENHAGFFHKLFCNYSTLKKTYNCDDHWSYKVENYDCGYEKTVYRNRLEDM